MRRLGTKILLGELPRNRERSCIFHHFPHPIGVGRGRLFLGNRSLHDSSGQISRQKARQSSETPQVQRRGRGRGRRRCRQLSTTMEKKLERWFLLTHRVFPEGSGGFDLIFLITSYNFSKFILLIIINLLLSDELPSASPLFSLLFVFYYFQFLFLKEDWWGGQPLTISRHF